MGRAQATTFGYGVAFALVVGSGGACHNAKPLPLPTPLPTPDTGPAQAPAPAARGCDDARSCPQDEVCEAGACHPSETCEAHEDCLSGQVCLAVGWEPAPPPASLASCEPASTWIHQRGEALGRRCGAGTRCDDDDGCAGSPGGPACLVDLGYCVECMEDRHCSWSRRFCDSLQLRCLPDRPAARCSDDADCCPETVACDRTCIQGTCAEPDECDTDCDCAFEEERTCGLDPRTDLGTCRPWCGPPYQVDHNACRGGPWPSCSDNFDCEEDLICLNSRCVSSDCVADEDCPNFESGGACRLLAPEIGLCQDGVCEEPGQAQTCLGGRVCDVDPTAGPEDVWVYCQEPCFDRSSDQRCPEGTFCDEDGGTGLCLGGAMGLCATGEMCAAGERCDGQRELPRCVAAGHDACRANADCGDGRFCIDEQCSAQAPVFCAEDDECPGRQQCNPAGACELTVACEDDADCPGNLGCNPGSGRCGACGEDADCVLAGRGVACGDAASGLFRACHEPPGGSCSQDAECYGNRSCDGVACQPAKCLDDWIHRVFHPDADPTEPDQLGNHTPAHAATVGARTIRDLRWCDGRDDWFRVEVGPGQHLDATIVWDVNAPVLADLSLVLLRLHC